MRQFFTLLATFVSLMLNAQTNVVTFEDIPVPNDSFLNGRDAGGRFISGNAIFPNTYFAMFDAWEGWAISNKTDTVTSGFRNQYSAKTGRGFDGSRNYGVTYGDERKIIFTNRVELVGFYVTNSTYAFNSMRDGDQFAKRFGGETGNDPDFFRLTVFKFLNGERSRDSVNFFLADFRFADNRLDYIVRTWEWVNLSALGQADSLLIRLASSDVGEFGINTPLYFCMDNLTTRNVVTNANDLTTIAELRVFPNPVTDNWLQVAWNGVQPALARLLDMNGRQLRNELIQPGIGRIDLGTLPAGVYLLQVQVGGQLHTEKIVKR